jgi:signal transduction histidine kinase
VLHERVRVAFSKSLLAHLAVSPLSALVVWLLWAHVDHRLLVATLLALNALAALGVAQVSTYRRRRPAATEARWWAANFLVGSIVYGAAWGAVGAALFVPGAIVAQAALVLLLAGLAAGALTTHLTLPSSLHAFHLLALGPLVVRLLVEGDDEHVALAGMLAVYLAALSAIGRAGARSVNEAIRLQLYNGRLIGELTAARGALESKSRELERRIEERTGQLAEARQLAIIGRLAGGIAHEVNNPLTWIMSNLQFLRDSIESDELPAKLGEEFRPALDDAIRGAGRIRGIVHDLTSLARHSPSEIGPVDLHGILRSAVNVAHGELKKRGSVEFDLDEIPPVLGNPGRLSQVFFNLVINAVDAMNPAAKAQNTLRIRTRESDDGSVVVEVSDTGCGIPPESLPEIFEPFYTTKTAEQGAGLGLAICKHIVEQAGGSIRAHSDGSGATFTITLRPATLDDAAETSVPGVG